MYHLSFNTYITHNLPRQVSQSIDRFFLKGSRSPPPPVRVRRAKLTRVETSFGRGIVLVKTVLKDFACRTAVIEHDFIQDKDAWSASVEGVKWTGVSMFRLASLVELRVMRTGQRSSDRDWLHQSRRTVAVVTGSHRTSPTESVKLALGQIHVSAVLGSGRKKGSGRESSSRHGDQARVQRKIWNVRKVREVTMAAGQNASETITAYIRAVPASAEPAVRPTLFA